MFQFSTSQLEALSAEITTREIRQQPELWKEAFDYYKANLERITAFLDRLPEGKLRVISQVRYITICGRYDSSLLKTYRK